MLKTLIIDSDPVHKDTIARMLLDYSDRIEVVGKASDILTAVHLVHQYQPDLIFLEIDMPTYSGFKLLDFFEAPSFQLIFMSNKNEDALKAFKRTALAYLVKPVVREKLHLVVQKTMLLTNEKSTQQLSSMEENRFRFPKKSGWFYMPLAEINIFESEGRYTRMHTVNKEQVLTTLSLKQCQELLEKTVFVRIHRSFMINLQYLQHYAKGKDAFVLLENGTRIDVGINFKEDLNKIASYFEK